MSIRIKLRIRLIVLISTFGVCWSTAQAEIIYVDSNPIFFGGDGTSWPTAFEYLQDGLSAAEYGDQIWVAAGTYKPTKLTDPNDPRTATFQMVNGVAIYGGFPDMGIPDFTDRNPGMYETILSGDLLGNDNPDTPAEDLSMNPYRTDNCYHVFYHPYGFVLDPNAVLDGFTITGGNADGSLQNPNPNYYGGGMANSFKSSPTVTNCTFNGNYAGRGGGMYNSDSSPTVTNCTFTGNSSPWGAGMLNSGRGSTTVTGCTFTNNQAGDGGGMANRGYCNSTVIYCIFSGNSASRFGGGMYNYQDSDPTVTGCTFTNNSADYGGGMYNGWECNPKVTNCIFWDNTASSEFNEIEERALVSYSCVQGGYTGTGNIDADPLFADPNGLDGIIGTEDDNLRLLTDSPCIDAGDPCYITGLGDVDKDGNPRVVDGNGDGIARIDMGPYEFQKKYCDGAGTPEDPYLICASLHMQQIGANPDDWDKYFKLTADIDLSAYMNAQFNIIGWYEDGLSNEPFTGVFDGNGHTISNFTHTSAGASYVGLFGYIAGQTAEIKDLGLIDPNINATTGISIGALAGCIGDGTTVSDCYVEGGTVTGDKMVGGLVGRTGAATVSRCSADCDVTGNGWGVGGLIGDAWQTTISACYATGSVTADNWGVGGLIGHQYAGQILTSYATGFVRGTDNGVGGLVGNAEGVYIEHCYAAGSVSGFDEVGGFAGRYSDGVILASFWDTLATGQVDGIGYEEQNGTVELYGRTTAQMRPLSTFTGYGWDFAGESANGSEDIWTIWEGAYYPRLTWENSITGDFTIDSNWMYQNLPGSTNSAITTTVSVTNDPLANNSYTYRWEFALPDDVATAPTTTGSCGPDDPCCTFAAPGCDQPAGLSDSGRPLTIQVTVTGDDHGNTGKAQAEFGIALLGDVNNDAVVNVADRAIINAFWRTDSAGPYTFTDCNINCDTAVNVADRAIANALWRGVLGRNRVSQPCPLR